MVIDVVALIGGLVLLAAGADRFVGGAAGIARTLGVTPMVVGLIVVGIGTSAPEMLVSAMAAVDGSPGIAVGNVLGSNIVNVTLVAGAAAVLAPLAVGSATLRREFPMLFVVTALAWGLCADGALTRTDGVSLMLVMVAVLWFIVRTARAAQEADPLRREFDARHAGAAPLKPALGWSLVGLGALLAGSKLVVSGASAIALAFGVSDLVVGLTVVAVGTSLPELAACVASARRGEPDMAVGNVLGSNLFNLLPVLAIAGLIEPFELEPQALRRDLPIMAALTVVLFVMCVGRRGPGRINRVEGGALLVLFAGYQGLLYVTQR